MIRITQLRLPVSHTEEDLKAAILKTLGIRETDLRRFRVTRRAIDARDKSDLKFVYTIEAEAAGEKKILARSRHRGNLAQADLARYHFPKSGTEPMKSRPIIIGSGPAGLFCTWMLARHGFRPILLERGEEASKRRQTVDRFWQGGILDPDSNVQFGEGGAGTFSDGKLATGVHDRCGRGREVLQIFVRAGAPEDILWDAHPHLGTDLLVPIVEKLREDIISFGGTVRFRSRVTDLLEEDGQVKGVRTASGETYRSDIVVLAIGHSARDTFEMLSGKNIRMEPKPFAVGVRIEHPQKMITEALYGPVAPAALGPAPYKLTHRTGGGRGVYSFCMCPGGWVVNASSEEGRLAVNGMSLRARDSANANSAIVVTVTPEDYLPWHAEGRAPALDGMYFQRALERKAFEAGEGAVPVQRFGDFLDRKAGGAGSFSPCIRGQFCYADVRGILPDFIGDSLAEGITAFDRQIPGFSNPDALLSGVESRTSSPVRIVRDENLESSLKGLYPAGEGAGYAGGITSAAMDGLRVAEQIAEKYAPPAASSAQE